MRKEYEMSEEQEKEILNACKSVPYIIVGGRPPRSPQENANDAWCALGKVMGFDGMTVEPNGKGTRFFTAEEVERCDEEALEGAKAEKVKEGVEQIFNEIEGACQSCSGSDEGGHDKLCPTRKSEALEGVPDQAPYSGQWAKEIMEFPKAIIVEMFQEAGRELAARNKHLHKVADTAIGKNLILETELAEARANSASVLKPKLRSCEEALARTEKEKPKLEIRLELAKRKEVNLCGDHHGKGYENADCILCEFEKRAMKGKKVLVDALNEIADSSTGLNGPFMQYDVTAVQSPPMALTRVIASEALKQLGEEDRR